MKTLKLTLSIIIIAFLACGNSVKAQTIQKEIHSELDNIMAWCLERPIDGVFIYHFTYHIDKETGKIDRVHWNTAKSDIWDSETGVKYKAIDTGNDNGGVMWEFWNNINNNVVNQWDVPNGWLPVPDVFPIEGSYVNMNFKFIGKGGNVFSMSWKYQLHINSSGEITVDKYTEYIDCN